MLQHECNRPNDINKIDPITFHEKRKTIRNVVIKLFLNRMNDQIAIAHFEREKKTNNNLNQQRSETEKNRSNLKIEKARNREYLEIMINVHKSPLDSVLICNRKKQNQTNRIISEREQQQQQCEI